MKKLTVIFDNFLKLQKGEELSSRKTWASIAVIVTRLGTPKSAV